MNKDEKSMDEILKSAPGEYFSIDQPKRHIANSVRSKMKEDNLSLRAVAESIDGLSYTQIHRITSKQNYNVDTLLKVLDTLGLEFEIKPK